MAARARRNPEPAALEPEAPREDHRVRVARVRRERMRAHLFQSVLSVCSSDTAHGAAVIDDVVRHAEVSRGTFYKYFDSLDQAIAELGLQLAEEMTRGIYSVYDVLDDPVLRTATGFQMFLYRAMLEPEWGAYIAHIGLLTGEGLFTHHIQTDIRLGLDKGDYVVETVEGAMDVLMGVKIEAIRRILQGRCEASYVRMMAGMVLRSFGVAPAKADKKVKAAFERLCVEAPGKIGWWRPVG